MIAIAMHVWVTFRCDHCKNSSTHRIPVDKIEAHYARYYEHHKKCVPLEEPASTEEPKA